MKTTITNHSDKRLAFRHDGGLAAIGPGESRDLIRLKLSAKTRAALELDGWEFSGGELDTLKAKADELGITYASNIGEATLSARIDAAAPESEDRAE